MLHVSPFAMPGAPALFADPASQVIGAHVFGRRAVSGDMQPPIFAAHANAATALVAGTPTKVAFQATDFDSSGAYSGSRFTPKTAGYYQISGSVSSGASTSYLIAIISKNGAGAAGLFGTYIFNGGGIPAIISHVSGLVYLNGSTDYVELWAQAGTAINSGGGANGDWFHGVLVRR